MGAWAGPRKVVAPLDLVLVEGDARHLRPEERRDIPTGPPNAAAAIQYLGQKRAEGETENFGVGGHTSAWHGTLSGGLQPVKKLLSCEISNSVPR